MKKILLPFPRHLVPFIKIHMLIAWIMAAMSSASFAQKDSIDYDDVPEDAGLLPNTVAPSMQKSNKLWIAYQRWSRDVMLCLSNEEPSYRSIKRLLKNQDAMDEAMKYFYGDSIEAKLSELLFAHQSIVAEIRKTVIDGDSAAYAEAYRQFRINKKQVIEFVRQANPLYTVVQAAVK